MKTVSLLCLLFIPTLVAAQDARELFGEGDRLVEEGRYTDALEAWRRAYLERLPAMRRRAFLHPVEARFLTREKLREFLVAMLDKELTPEDVRAAELSMEALGLAGRDLDLRALYTDLYTEQIAGFYDPETKSLYLIAEEEDGKKPRKKSIWNLFSGSSFDPTEQKSVLSHEMSHALADQHFDLYSMQRSIEEDDDMTMAFSALVEGEAMLVMMLDSAFGPRTDLPSALRAIAASVSNPLLLGIQSAAIGLAGGTLRDAPRFVRESLVFPYIQGMQFCGELARSGSWERIDRAFREPPTSTEQILHPERFGEDVPVEIVADGRSALEESGWQRVESNCLGEFGVRVALRDAVGKSRANQAAAGWDGDRYLVFAPPTTDPTERTPCLVWATTWDSDDDADEFARALLEARADGVELSEGAARHARSGGRSLVIRRSGSDVLCIDHCPDEQLESVVRWAESFQRRPKALRWRHFRSEVEFARRRRV